MCSISPKILYQLPTKTDEGTVSVRHRIPTEIGALFEIA
jgi:hypothetical protein